MTVIRPNSVSGINSITGQGGDINLFRADGTKADIPTVNNITAGVVTATSFSGSGANLTSLPAANLTGTLPAISGANLTGITGTTINNNADNRLITGSGTANTLNAETSGTFSSGQLKILTDGASGSGIRLVGKSGNSGAEIDFYNNADNSLQGYIEFSDAGSRFWNLTNTDIHFRTNNTERLRILASGGLTFHGDTASANALNDYEEGTWTPQIKGTTGAGTASYSNQVGKYLKIGNWVYLTWVLGWSSGSAGGEMRTTGFPFSPATDCTGMGSVMFNNVSIHSNVSNIATYIGPGNDYCYFYTSRSSSGWITVNYSSSGNLIANVSFRTA